MALMPYRLYLWLALQSGSVAGSLLALLMLVQDGTAAGLFMISVAVLTWLSRPKDWRDAFSQL
jgi:hypothetical protein